MHAICLIATILMSVTFGSGGPAYAEVTKCEKEDHVETEEYWFWEGLFGIQDVKETATELHGRLVFRPHVCVTVPKKDLRDPLLRARGYKKALLDLSMGIPGTQEDLDKDPRWQYARERIQILTGRDVRSLADVEDLVRWWRDNEAFLIWSDERNELVVDEASKSAGRPLHEDPTQIQDLSAMAYWFYEAMGWLRDVREENGMVLVEVWTGETVIKGRIQTKDLAIRKSKETGYRNAIERRINSYLLRLEGKGLERLMSKLRELTGEPFHTQEEWVQWWDANSQKLVLSPDGRRLVVGAENGAREEAGK